MLRGKVCIYFIALHEYQTLLRIYYIHHRHTTSCIVLCIFIVKMILQSENNQLWNTIKQLIDVGCSEEWSRMVVVVVEAEAERDR